MTGRRLDAIWQHFIKLKNDDKPLRAKCIYCKKEMCALVARMKTHIQKCKNKNKDQLEVEMDDNINNEYERQNFSSNSDTEVNLENDHTDRPIRSVTQSSPSSSSSSLPTISSRSLKKSDGKLDSYTIRTTKMESDTIDLQIAKFIYGTNSSFRLVEHLEFKKMVNLLRPGYNPPTRHQIATTLLDKVYISIKQTIEQNLKGKIVSMAMDGWSNLHVEPIVCISVTDISEGNIHLIDTIDTAENRHTADYLLDLAVVAIKSCQKFNCTVKSFVTDNASNMVKMRCQLSQREEIGMPDIITYGCSAHILNLLAKDIDVPDLKDNVKKIIKYFRNTHFPAAKYKQAGGTSLSLPIDVRWNTLSDCFESYLKNWHILAKVCTENRAAIDVEISSLVQDLNLKTNVQNYLVKHKQISIALDKVQNEMCTIGEATEIWLNLLQSIKDKENTEYVLTELELERFKSRFSMAMTPSHYLANLLDHRFTGQKLKQDQLEEALQYAATYHPDAMPFIIQYQAKCSPFREYLFLTQNIENVSPVSWWCALKSSINNAMFDLAMQLHTAVASSAGIERLFSTFGLVHSKLRNRLGTEKASKLVSIIRTLNSNLIFKDENE